MPVGATDELADFLSGIAISGEVCADETNREKLKIILIDSFAVALAALRHPAAVAARRYASNFASGDAACAIWGTSRRVNAEVAALCNGVLLRCHDYNDLYIGQGSWGHPSDIVAALLAVAERRRASGADLLQALAVGYDVTLALFDTLPAASVGWDYCNLTALGAVCGLAPLLRLTQQQVREALAIAAISHVASDEIESGDLNRNGDLTMWKRFNAGDAMRQAVYACDLAAAGAEGAVRPFEGRHGLLAKLGVKNNPLPKLRERLGDSRLTHLDRVVFKRWPVGSRAQAAIAAALEVRRDIACVGDIAAIRVRTTHEVYEHLVRSRPAPWAPISRETADHSLPYIVASAVLDGRIGTDSFALSRVLDPKRQAFLNKVEITPDLEAQQQQGVEAFAAHVEIVMTDGRRVTARAKSEMHDLRRTVEDKFAESAKARLSPTNKGATLDLLHNLERCPDLRALTQTLAVENEAALDGDLEE
jgi:2-methylcitrate dehydratase